MVPEMVLEVWVRFAGPVNDSAYYFIALDRDGDFGEDYPIPIANGPFWGNGWGTGSITHFLEYHLGAYEYYEATLAPVLREPGSGITAVGGVPDGGDSGRYELTIGGIAYGDVVVTGTGMIQSAANNSGQNAGTIALATDAGGKVVAGSVSFTPSADGGRSANAQEQAQLDALNAGGATLGADSLSAFGLSLTLGAASAGTQSLEIAPAIAAVEAKFIPIAAGVSRITQTTLRANSSTPTDNPPIPGAGLTTGDLAMGGTVPVDVEISQQPVYVGPPFAFTPPQSGSTLSAQIDLADIGANLDDLSLNIIATTELIFDPTVTDPDRHSFDGLGPLGNDAISFSAGELRLYTNSAAFAPEGANDETLKGLTTQAQRDSVDIIDWTVQIKRLR